MTTWIDIPESWIDPESPITYQLMKALRDNITAFAEGATGAPHMETALLFPGGSIADGILDNTVTISNSGYYDFEGESSRTTAFALPYFTYIRVRGDFAISNTWTVSKWTDDEAIKLFGLTEGRRGGKPAGSQTNGGGAGNHGAGGDADGSSGGFGAGGVARSLSLQRWWLSRTLPTGGAGGEGLNGHADGGQGGGTLVLIVEGDLDLTGGTITAPGGVGDAFGGGGGDPAESGGGGSGGVIIIICTGTITGGTLLAAGGAGGGNNAGGGAGGAVVMVASAYAGTQTLTCAGGNGPGSGDNGAAGYTETTTLLDSEINGLLVHP